MKVFRVIRKSVFLLVLAALLALCGWGYFNTTTNYDVTSYLPADSPTAKGLEKMTQEFGSASYARVMVTDITVEAASELKSLLANVSGVNYTLWLDDIFTMLTASISNSDSSEETPPPSSEDLINGLEDLGGTGELAGILEEFIAALKNASSPSVLLKYVTENSIILDLCDLVLKYEFYGAMQFTSYYNAASKTALIEIYFTEGDYSAVTDEALTEIMNICNDRGLKNKTFLDGSAVNAKAARDTTSQQALAGTVWAIPILIIILLLATTSFFEPVVFLITIGVSVIFNMGTNILFQLTGLLDGVSFITTSMAAALQMAISMDYSIFLLDQFKEAKKHTPDNHQAMKTAMKRSFGPVTASCLTTIAGFLAISLMKFGIGKDIGFVFTKGILLSYLCVFVIMPFFIRLFERPMNHFRHRDLMPSGRKFSKLVSRFSGWIVLVVLVLGGGSYFLQRNMTFLYGEGAMGSSEGTETYEDKLAIESVFGIYNPTVLIVPINLRDRNDDNHLVNANDRESQMLENLSQIKVGNKNMIQGIMGYRAMVRPGMEELMPEALVGNFDSENYTRLILRVDADIESAEAFETLNQIETVVQRYTPEYYLIGSTSAAMDMKETVESDYSFVNMLAIVAVGVIILIMFRSVLLPFLLVATIEMGIFINMALSALSGSTLSFLGYLVVSLIELGATIDYAILLTKNYVLARHKMPKRAALESCIRKSMSSVLTSAAILGAAGFCIGFVSTVSAVSEIGILIGRGALISGFLVLGFLPPLLMITDKYIRLTSYKINFYEPKNKPRPLPASDDGNAALSGEDTTATVETFDLPLGPENTRPVSGDSLGTPSSGTPEPPETPASPAESSEDPDKEAADET